MTIRPLKLAWVEGREDFLPHAILGLSVHEAIRTSKAAVESGSDKFDAFDEGVALLLDERVPFVLMHYSGHPDGTSTVYLPPSIQDLDTITQTVADIVSGLRLDEGALRWQRADDPNL